MHCKRQIFPVCCVCVCVFAHTLFAVMLISLVSINKYRKHLWQIKTCKCVYNVWILCDSCCHPVTWAMWEQLVMRSVKNWLSRRNELIKKKSYFLQQVIMPPTACLACAAVDFARLASILLHGQSRDHLWLPNKYPAKVVQKDSQTFCHMFENPFLEWRFLQ